MILRRNAPKLKSRWQTPCFEKLSGLEWPALKVVSSYGAQIGLRADSPETLESLVDRLPSHVKQSDATQLDCVLSVIHGKNSDGSRQRNYSLLYQNHVLIARCPDFEEILERFDSYFMLATAQLAPDLVFIHSCAVNINGQVVLAPGKTLAGKSTLARAFLDSGAQYMSDEYAIADENGLIQPYARPLSIRPTPTAKQVNIPVDRSAGAVADQPFPPAMVIFTQYKKGGRWSPRRLSPGQGILHLMEQSIGAQYQPDRVMKTLARTFKHAEFFMSERGEAHEVAKHVMDKYQESYAVL